MANGNGTTVSQNVADNVATLEGLKFAAEAKKLEAETRAAVAAAEAAEIKLEKEREDRDFRLTADRYHHVYRFTKDVSESSVAACLAQLAQWDRLSPDCDMEIVFTSPGGNVIDGMALFDFIQQMKRAGHKVTTSALGEAASMAGILLQAGDVRVMGKETWILIHQATFGTIGSTYEVEDELEFVKKIQKRILAIFVARSNLTEGQIKRRWHRKDWWIDSDEALKLGLVDEVR